MTAAYHIEAGQRFGLWTVLGLAETPRRRWLCRCECGEERPLPTADLVHGKSMSCGKHRDPCPGAIDMTGQTYGFLTCLRRVGNSSRWLCLCQCGNETVADGHGLRTGRAKSCGCWNTRVRRARVFQMADERLIDLSGQRFGKLVVKRHHDGMWLCECDCGQRVQAKSDRLRSGQTASCGCGRPVSITHGHTRGRKSTPEYRVWCSMLTRCTNATHASYPRYGGRGIRVTSEWMGPGGFESFLAHVGKRPSLSHTIDRYPNGAGHYEPGNVRWATRAEQSRNRRVSILVTHEGVTKCVAEWARDVGLSPYTVYHRIKAQGMSPERALGFIE